MAFCPQQHFHRDRADGFTGMLLDHALLHQFPHHLAPTPEELADLFTRQRPHTHILVRVRHRQRRHELHNRFQAAAGVPPMLVQLDKLLQKQLVDPRLGVGMLGALVQLLGVQREREEVFLKIIRAGKLFDTKLFQLRHPRVVLRQCVGRHPPGTRGVRRPPQLFEAQLALDVLALARLLGGGRLRRGLGRGLGWGLRR